jgi:hypothetical protein
VRSGASQHFFYIPNFCIAEVFDVFMKYTYGHWNKHVKAGTLDKRIYRSIRNQFQQDIHNATLFYHYELSRYHVLALNLVGPVDHYFRLAHADTQKGKNVVPAGTFDHLLIAMGLHLVKLHGQGNVVIVTADDRLEKVVKKCRAQLPSATVKKLGLDEAGTFTGIPFAPESFPDVINLKTASQSTLVKHFGAWPLTVAKPYTKPYLARIP